VKKMKTAAFAVLLLASMPCFGAKDQPDKWQGVDETVVEKFAEKAGRPARKPLINTDQGDLLLFVFLVGGAAGGFVGGYYFRELFPGKAKKGN
jgi:cobalt/nickel transport protein